MVRKYGQEEHQVGRGSYSFNQYFDWYGSCGSVFTPGVVAFNIVAMATRGWWGIWELLS